MDDFVAICQSPKSEFEYRVALFEKTALGYWATFIDEEGFQSSEHYSQDDIEKSSGSILKIGISKNEKWLFDARTAMDFCNEVFGRNDYAEIIYEDILSNFATLIS